MTPSTADAQLKLSARPVAPERYELLGVLGQGAMGIVYKARDRELDREVAIKTLQRQDARGSGADVEAIAGRLSREAMAAARLSHPGIVTVYDVGRFAGTPYVVMEYFTGRTLTELLESGPLSPDRAVHVALQVCRALAYAHGQGVVHRDVKSSNIMVDTGWHAKLTDFGVARIVDKPANDAGMMIGTPAYMSPEQARGGATDARSDLFSVGVVLYEALTGATPFPGTDLARVLDDVVRLDPVPPRERNFAVSPALDAVVRRVMGKVPDDRYPDAMSLAEALAQAGALSDTAPGERALHHPRRRTAVIAAALIALAVGAALYLPARFGDPASQEPTPVAPVELQASMELPRRAAAPEKEVGTPACLSVNAVPFATVYVDGREKGDTPQACVRVGSGQHRVHFRWLQRRSPDHVVEVGAQHTADNPLRVSYDFRTGRFLSHAD
ncbi:MAG: serine/threonine protein kinase [Candidatus Rokuibacteriota bacterium]|nr:MAG: serine/threonine protein kinase [Candidatus Rokubacteria bacterium]